jgi:PST family polysaccharide transporter
MKHRLSKTLSLSLFAEFINKISPLLIMYFVLRRIGVSEFGEAQFGISLIEMTIGFVVFGYSAYGSIEVGKIRRSNDALPVLIANIWTLRVIHTLVSILAVSLILSSIPQYRDSLGIFWILSFVLFATSFELSWVQVGMQQLATFNLIQTFSKIPSLIAILLFVDDPKDGVLYAVLLLMANALVGIITSVIVVRKYGIAKPQLNKLGGIIKQSSIMGVSLIAFGMIDRIDVMVAELVSSSSDVGIYSGQMRLVHSIAQIVSVIAAVFFSESIAITADRQRKAHLQLSYFILLSISSAIFAGSWFVSKPIVDFILGNEFGDHHYIFCLLCGLLIANAPIQIIGWQGLWIKGYVKLVASSLVIACAAATVLSYFGAKNFGLLGIAAGVVVGRSVASVLLIRLSGTDFRFPLSVYIRSFLPSLIMTLALFSMRSESMHINLPVGVIVFIGIHFFFNRRWITDKRAVLASTD